MILLKTLFKMKKKLLNKDKVVQKQSLKAPLFLKTRKPFKIKDEDSSVLEEMAKNRRKMISSKFNLKFWQYRYFEAISQSPIRNNNQDKNRSLTMFETSSKHDQSKASSCGSRQGKISSKQMLIGRSQFLNAQLLALCLNKKKWYDH